MPHHKQRQHGVQGVYYGGDWLDIEHCARDFKIERKVGDCGRECSTCPRSRSAKSAAKADGSYDVVIIGAGCIGAAIARELSRTTASVLILEAADDVTQVAHRPCAG
jgi:glycerol-3-phosphate dehydrogenase